MIKNRPIKGKAMKILIVDDNSENIEVMTIMLKSRNYEIIQANNGQEALEKLHSVKFDLIISDILMPVMDGFQLCRECKKDTELSKISFIFYTATYTDSKDEEFALALGAQKFIRKPQEPEVFLNLVKEVIIKSKNRKSTAIKYKKQDEKEILKLYSERLVVKLEKKNLDLENEINSHKITLNMLKESEEKYKTLFDDAMEAIFIADTESGILLDCNEAACTLVDKRKEELVGKHQSILHPPDELVDTFTQSFWKHIMNETKQLINSQVVTKSGIIKDVEIKAKFLNIGGKKIIQGFFNDVTERLSAEQAGKRAEDELRNSRNMLQIVLDSIPAAVFWKNRDLIYLGGNRTWLEAVGMKSSEEVAGKSDYDLSWKKEQADSFREYDRKIIESGIPEYNIIESYLRADGTQAWAKTNKIPFRDAEGNIVGVLGSYEDITEHKLTEEALHANERMLTSIFNTVGDIIFLLAIEANDNYRFISVNRAFCNVTGLSEEMVVGKLVDEVIPEPSLSMVLEKYRQAINENTIIRWEETSEYPTGQLIADVSIAPVVDNKGRCSHLVGSVHDITRRKQMEEILYESEKKYRSIFENVQDVYYETLLDGDIAEVSPSIGIISRGQYHREDLIGKSIYEFYSDIRDRDTLIETMQKTGSVTDYEVQLRNRDGSFIWCSVSAKMSINAEGKLEKIIGSMHDITDRKKAELALCENEEIFSKFIEHSPIYVFFKDENIRAIRLSKNYELMLGKPIDELLGKNMDDLFPSELAKGMVADDIRILKEGKGITIEEELNGRLYTTIKFPIYIDGKPRYLAGYTIDITERKQAEETLKTSEEKFRLIFDNASDGMFLLDGETKKFIMYNTACLKMLGYSDEEFLNLDITAIYPSGELTFILEQIEKILKGEEGISRDIKFKRKSGNVFTTDLSPTLVTIAGEKLILVAFRDITDRMLIEIELRSAKEKAEESDKLKTAFLQNISHEIRTPLNGIIGFSDMITNPNLSHEKLKQYSQIIRDSGDQLISIVNDIIVIATIEAGQEKPYEKETDINKLLHIIKNLYNLKVEAKNLSFTVSSALTNDEAIVLVDETKLLQILTNLVNNAIKFTSEGYIKVNCMLHGKFLKFLVKDSGIGIAPEMHEKIFDRFFQIDYTATRSYGGTGLGLSIVKSYVHFLKGEIYLDSEPGTGSTFYFTIPYTPVLKEDRSAETAFKSEKMNLEGRVILIAEDDEINYAYLEEILIAEKVKTIRANNGKEAVELCKTMPEIELVLMDIKMPLLNGYDATKQILKFRKNLPIIAQTAYALPDDRGIAINSGCVDYISKPVYYEQLMAILHKYLK